MKNNANFYGGFRSAIQESIEYNQQVYGVKAYIRDMDAKYNVENAVFGYDFGARKLDEIREGYLEIEGEYETVSEALDNMSRIDECVHIVRKGDDHVYRLGKWNAKLSDCKGSTMDIERLTDIR